MKKFLQNVSLFAISLVPLLLMLNVIFENMARPNDYYRLQYDEVINHGVNADNIIIGTSHATHGIQPKILDNPGKTFFNFALNGSNPQFYLFWYENIFKPYYKKPTYVIISTDWFFFDTKWLWRRYEQDSEYFPAQVFYRNLFNTEGIDRTLLINNRYPVLKYRKLFDRLLNYNSAPYLIREYKDGFIPYEVTNPTIEELTPENKIDSAQQRDFERLIKMFIDDGVRVIFINTPEYNTHPEQYLSLPVYLYYNLLAKKYSIPFLNYNIEKRSFINTSKVYYSDGGHLNTLGSIKFSEMLKKDLNKLME